MTSALEDIKSIDLEEWLTLNTASAPTKLKLGQTPNLENIWVDEKPGSIITAPGFIKVGSIPSGNPVTFCINFFRTNAGTQTFVVSDNATVWTTVDFQNFTSIITGLSASFQLRGKVIRDKLWLVNGSDPVRTFDGTSVVILNGSGGTPNVPKGRYIDYHDERVWLYHLPTDRSNSAFSALTDSSGTIITPDNANAWPSSNTLQISEGDADFGTGLLLYRGYLHFFKQYSIWRLVGYDEYTYTRVKTRASTGTRFNESVQILDSLVHLIGVDGIYVFDGEESQRISDIIDPATASQTAFGFNQLQQPNANNQFFEVATTADWNAGTLSRDLAVADQIALVATDDSQADFQGGATLTNIDTTTFPGSISLSRITTGTANSNEDIAANQDVEYKFQPTAGSIIGSPSNVTDGSTSSVFGCVGSSSIGPPTLFGILINLSRTEYINLIALTRIQGTGTAFVAAWINPSSPVDISTLDLTAPSGFTAAGSTGTFAISSTAQDKSISFSALHASQVLLVALISPTQQFYFGAGRIYASSYSATGAFVSRTMDYGSLPLSYGNFNATAGPIVSPGHSSVSYYTQASDDGTTWDVGVAVTNGGAVASTLRRYIRWGASFTSDGSDSILLSAAFFSAVYVSAVHDTGGSISSWGPFEADRSYAGQAINFYYRTGTTLGSVAVAIWNGIVPGGVISDPVANQFVQFKIEILSGTDSNLPTVTSVTINWVSGTAGQPTTLQNVASAYWRNRYWLSAAGPGATENDTLLIRGKKTFNSPWMLKDWSILSFTRFHDSLYGGSSVDGSIYQLDTGYSKDGAMMDSYFETGDFVFGGFTANFVELLVEAERTGMWDLIIGASVDGGRTYTEYTMDLTPSTYDTNYMKRININFTTTRIRFRFRTNGIDTPFQVHRCIAFYKLGGERGSIRGDYM